LDDSLWSARVLDNQPELIQDVHLAYFRAGADIATTASYQATLPGFLALDYDQKTARQLIRRSVQLAQDARQQFWETADTTKRLYPLIAASVGPYGAYLADGSEYSGRYGISKQQLTDFHQPRLEWLLEEQPDLIAFETLPCLEEAEVLLRLLEHYPKQQAWFSFSARDDKSISDGTPVEEIARLLGEHTQVAALGINCTPPDYILGLLERLGANTGKPLITYPNSGEGWDAERRCWLTASRSPEGFGDWPPKWINAGARIIGGCCRTGPEDVKILREHRALPS
jgi:homocysteine S-methyltransferase